MKMGGSRPRTHCSKGHRYDELNTYRVDTRGYQHCRACELDRSRTRHGNRPNRPPDTSWMVDAVCANEGAPTEHFFPENQLIPRRARELRALFCDRCPVATECFRTAVAYGAQGIWAGMSQRQRTEMTQTLTPHDPVPVEFDPDEVGLPGDTEDERREVLLVALRGFTFRYGAR